MTRMTDFLLEVMCVDVRVLLVTAPPRFCFEDVEVDVRRLITKHAVRYTDPTCCALHTDNLEGEGWAAFNNVLQKRWHYRARTRSEFFRVTKAAVANRMRSMVQQHRFTEKRTGIKPVSKEERKRQMSLPSFEHEHTRELTKPIEISLNDPDAHLQVEDLHETPMIAEELDAKALEAEIARRCSPIELVALKELLEPSAGALFYAQLDTFRGKRSARVQVTITDRHRILGAGFKPGQFEEAVLRIQEITTCVMNAEDAPYQAALDKMEQVFDLQIPRHISPSVVRRMLTVAAADNWAKVTPEVEAVLTELGAVAPKFNAAGSINCFGWLHEANNPVCESCGIKVNCAAKVANLALNEITIHPKLLGAKLNRVPVLLPAPRGGLPPTSTLRDMEIVLRYVTYAIFTGDASVLEDRCLNGLRETYLALGVPGASVAEGIRKMKDAAIAIANDRNGITQGDCSSLMSEIGTYFDRAAAAVA
jgi:hypothetical protein